MTLKAIILDFDGTILDTETPEVRAWCEIFGDYDLKLDDTVWKEIIGAVDEEVDLAARLQERVDFPIDCEAIRWRAHEIRMALIAKQKICPGILPLIKEACERGLELGIVSTSPRVWIEEHLGNLGLQDEFDVIVSSDDVENTKPHPEPYLTALDGLSIDPDEAFVLEDSALGVVSANAAGIRVIAVPNESTGDFDFSAADMVVESLPGMSIDELMGGI